MNFNNNNNNSPWNVSTNGHNTLLNNFSNANNSVSIPTIGPLPIDTLGGHSTVTIPFHTNNGQFIPTQILPVMTYGNTSSIITQPYKNSKGEINPGDIITFSHGSY